MRKKGDKDNKKLKVLLIAPSKSSVNGGIAKWTRLIVDILMRRPGVEYRVVNTAPVCINTSKKNLPERILSGLMIFPLHILRIFQAMITFRPDVIHITTSGSLAVFRDISVLIMSYAFGIKSVYHIHMGRLPDLEKSRNWEWLLLNKAFNLASMIIVMDSVSLITMKGYIGEKKIAYVPNMIELGLESSHKTQRTGYGRTGSPNKDKVVLYLGWIIPDKGLMELVKAWVGVETNGWKLKMIGPGPDSFRKMLLGIVNGRTNVSILEEVSQEEGWKYMKEAEIFVLPSYTEGFPNVILEAMAAAKPIIATPVGAIPDILEFMGTEPCGLMVPVGDEKILGERMKEMMSNNSLRNHLGAMAYAKVERSYGTYVVYNKINKIWKEIAGFYE